jgi:hypothetical protein
VTQQVVFRPHPGKQEAIFTSSADHILAGGGKKSGKSQAAIARPLPHVHDSRFRCIVIRRTVPGLKYIEGQAYKLYRKIYGKGLDHNKTQHLFTFPSGAQILFTFAAGLEDCEKLEGWGYQMLIVDEARQFPDPLVIDTLSAELYAENDPTTGMPWMKPLLLLLSNPGGRGGEWLRKRFAIDKFPKGGHDIYDPVTKRYRLYIHMTVHDNPSMSAEDYINGLRIYPIYKQRQMIDGDWFQKDGSAFEEFDASKHIISKYDVEGCEIHRSCDWGFASVCAIHYWAVRPEYNSTVCVDELHFSRVRPRDVARACLKLEEERGYEVVRGVIGDDADSDKTAGLSPYAQMADEGVFFRKVRYAREDGYRATVARLTTMITLHDGSQVPAVRFVEDRCPHLWQSLPTLPQKVGEDDVDKNETKQADGGKGNDHDFDSAKMHFCSLPLPESEPEIAERFSGVPSDHELERTNRNKTAHRPHQMRGF